jgi:hypothetical protein
MKPSRPGPVRRGPNPVAPREAPVQIEGYIFTSSQISICFVLACAAILGNAIWHLGSTDITTLAAYLLIAFGWAVPTGLWSRGKANGMPLYPIFCSVNFIAFGLPLLTDHPWVVIFPPEAHLQAAWTIASGLLAGTAVWFTLTRRHGRAPITCLQMDDKGGETLLLLAITLSVLFNLNRMTLWLPLEGGVLGLIRGVIEGLSMLGIFVLGQRMGSGRLQPKYVSFYVVLLVCQSAIQITSLLLVNIFSTVILACAGYFLGSRRFPWLVLGSFALLLAFFHGGKSEIRNKYWDFGGSQVVLRSLGDFFELYDRWIEYSWRNLTTSAAQDEERASQSTLVERTSLMHLLLYMQDLNQKGLNHLEGSTYTIIPSLLTPRVINPDKPWSHEGTYRLNIHYGIQTREETTTTTIGFGLLNEGYGNFGYLGCVGICMCIGALFGWVSRWAWGMPVLSFRSLFSVLVLGASFQTEYSMGVFITVLFQGTMALGFFSFFFMKKRPHSGVLDWLRTHETATLPTT